MERTVKATQKRCVYCGRFYRPDNRVGKRQKSCGREECRRRRKYDA